MIEATKDIIKNIDKIKTVQDLSIFKRQLSKKYGISLLLNSDILKEYNELLSSSYLSKDWLEKYGEHFLSLLRKRSVRTLSGIAPVAVLTKPYDCPGQCAYCPKKPDMPVSYLPNEPAVMRAIRLSYSPYLQSAFRLKALENNGHHPSKIELIVIGGTWSYLPEKYQYWYILNCFKAVNDYDKVKKEIEIKKSKKQLSPKHLLKHQYPLNISLKDLKLLLKKEQKRNEKAKYNIIGLTLETRPDYINEKELWRMRDLGCTRVEIGVQAVDDKILKLNKRGHKVESIILASKKLKQFGFKLTYHFMPALPGSNPEHDFEMYRQIYTDENFQPDQIKFYPTTVVKDSLLYDWWKDGKYTAYSDKELEDLIIKCKAVTPKYTRIIRLIRDIPGESIEAGNKITNLRQIMKSKGLKCACIRCREAKDNLIDPDNIKLEIVEYDSSGGHEYFISFVNKDSSILYAFCRLRIDKESPISLALIRELHVYGQLVPVGSNKKVQHSGLGAKLIAKAEEISLKNGAKSLSIISGVGVRNYYRKHAYKLLKTYMKKSLLKN